MDQLRHFHVNKMQLGGQSDCVGELVSPASAYLLSLSFRRLYGGLACRVRVRRVVGGKDEKAEGSQVCMPWPAHSASVNPPKIQNIPKNISIYYFGSNTGEKRAGRWSNACTSASR